MNKTEIVKTLMETQKQYGLVHTLHSVFGKNIKINISFSQRSCDTNIDNLVLSVRSYNALRRANVFTIGDLIERLNEGGLKNIRNLGVKSCREIQTKLLVFFFERLSEEERQIFYFRLLEDNMAQQ